MKKSFPKRAFTLAETIMTLFIVGLVVTAAIPAFTVKQKNVDPSKEADTPQAKYPWSYCTKDPARGLCGIYNSTGSYNSNGSKLLIGSDSTSDIEDVVVGTSYDVTIVNSNTQDNVFDLFQSDERNFQVGTYHFREHGTNLYITQDDKISQSASVDSNVIIGKGNQVKKTSEGENLIGTGFNLSNSVIIGTNNSVVKDGAVSANTIIGNNNVSGGNHNTLFGSGNNTEVNRTTNVFIGNNNSNAIAGESSLRIGIGLAAHNFNIGNVMYADISGAPAELGPLTFAHPVTLTGLLKTNSIVADSDERLKNIKGSYDKGLNEILKVNPVNFKYKNSDKLQTGVIAQDIQGIFPEAVVTMPNGYLGVNNDPIFFAMLNAMKEVNLKAETEEQRQIELQKELNDLKAEIEALNTCDATDIWSKIKCFFVKIKRNVMTVLAQRNNPISPLAQREREENRCEEMSIRFSGEGITCQSEPSPACVVRYAHTPATSPDGRGEYAAMLSTREYNTCHCEEAECRRDNLFHARTAQDMKWIASLPMVVRNDGENEKLDNEKQNNEKLNNEKLKMKNEGTCHCEEAECRRGNLFHARTAPDMKWIASLPMVVRNDEENEITRGAA